MDSLWIVLFVTLFGWSCGNTTTEPPPSDITCGYKACQPLSQDEKVLNVHIVAHTHMDVGWLKTVDQYFYGANSSIQNAGVQYILDAILNALTHDPFKRFVLVESAFISQWYTQLGDAERHALQRLILKGQLEIAGGGWVMHDEAVTHYTAAIDQMTLGHRFLNSTLGQCARPLTAWQIDPFGHSQEHASLFAQMALDGVFLGRISYFDKIKRLAEKNMEMVWEGSRSLGAASQLFGGVLYNTYSPPPGFCFDILCGDQPLVDDPQSDEYNIDEKVKLFTDWAIRQASSYKTNNILVTMGNDFNYQSANTWFKNLDILISNVNGKSEKLHLFYSTPGCYLKAVNDANVTWDVKTDDFLPYASDPYTYWTGFYTSRPNVKYYERLGNHYLQVCQQLGSFFQSNSVTGFDVPNLQRAVATLQHHDAVTGTERQPVAYDYAKRLSKSWHEGEIVVNNAFNRLLEFGKNPPIFTTCPLLNISQCDVTENNDQFLVMAYNPLARATDLLVRVPVFSGSTEYSVVGPKGEHIVSQIIPISKPLLQLPGRFSKADHNLVFYTSELPAFGSKTYHITKGNISANASRYRAKRFTFDSKMIKVHRSGRSSENYTIGNDNMQLTFDVNTGMLTSINSGSVTIPMKQQLLYYKAMAGNNTDYKYRASGAYIFRPNGSTPSSLTDAVKIKVFKGPVVDEVHQQFSPWVSQVVRVCKMCNFAEFEWQVGPIPIDDNIGKEIISQFTSNLETKGEFLTDANSRENILRKRDNAILEPIARNYYPVTSRIEIGDKDGRRFAVLTDRSQGGSSLKDGQIELMVHRRLLHDDAFGVGEALNETAYGEGMVARGIHRLVISGSKEQWNAQEVRNLVQDSNQGPFLFFAPTSESFVQISKQFKTQFSGFGGKTAVPSPVNVLSLEPWTAGSTLLRLEHTLPVDEGGVDVSVDLSTMFSRSVLNITSIRETTLSANQWLDEVERLHWNTGTENATPSKIIKLNEIKMSPMQIRTFVLNQYN